MSVRDYNERCVCCGRNGTVQVYGDHCERCKREADEREQEPLTEGPTGVAGFLSGRYV